MAYKQTADVRLLRETNGIRFYRIHTDKFKTARTDVFFIDDLTARTAPANSLVPAMLKRGCEKYPTALALERKMEGLYGASFDYQVMKKGETQVVHMGISHVADRYASGGEPLFLDSARLLMEILTKPVLKDGLFRTDFFAQEKTNLIDSIKSRVNDKIHYASMRCTEEMCKGEAYAIPADGNEAEALALCVEDVVAAWRRLVFERPAYVYFSGELPEEHAEKWMELFEALPRKTQAVSVLSGTSPMGRPVQTVTEKMDVNQGKLCMGLRTHVAATSVDWPALMVYNGILGGDLHSKLFQNVREKASLAYYASSRPERNKGLLFINSGIEAENREKAEQIIMEQLEDMKKGNITEDEYVSTQRSLATSFKSAQDSQYGIVEYSFGQHFLGIEATIEALAANVALVKVEDVVRVAQGVTLDTVYFLAPEMTMQE